MLGFDLSLPSWDGWFDKTCQLQEETETLAGGLQQTALAPAAAYPNPIACNVQSSGGRQVQTGPERFELSSHIVYLRGFFPDAKKTMSALIGNQTHEILLIDDAGASCCTILVTRTL